MKSTTFKHLFKSVLWVMLCLASCKKDNPTTDNPPDQGGNTKQTPTTDRVELTNDSIFLYAKEIYYWNDKLPSYDTYEPRQYTTGGTDLAKYERNLLDLVTYSGYEYIEGQDYPKFSYIEDISDNNGLSAGIRNLTSGVNLQGEGNDIGIYHIGAYGPENETSFKVFIKAVYPGSPAAKAGLTRGASITKIGSREIGNDWEGDVPFLNQLLNDPSSIHLEGEKAGGGTFNVDLVKEEYESSPIYKDTVLQVGGKSIGYLAYARFSDGDNSNDVLNAAFDKFAAGNVGDLVVDLRYNGGGYVETAEYLANLIAPAGTSGTMFVEHYNSQMQEGKAAILQNQPVRNSNGDIVGTGTYADFGYDVQTNTRAFAKKGALTGVKNIIFLVSGATASSSELLINSLRAVPTLTVKIVGTTTYGKPVGFFPVRLEGKYDLYLSSFSTKNANEQGDYYNGFKPGTDIEGTEMIDELDQDKDNFSDSDFGNTDELYLAEALKLLDVNLAATSNRLMATRSSSSTNKNVANFAKGIQPKNDFKGMIETRITK